MSKINYKLTAGLSREQLKNMHKDALLVIEKIGIDIPHQKTLKLLSGTKGVTIKGTFDERFNRTLKEEFIQLGNYTPFPEEFNPDLTEWLVEYNFNRPHQSYCEWLSYLLSGLVYSRSRGENYYQSSWETS